ncbi:MAG: hypothetical protein Q4B03_01750 [Lachnospiraceae bacterium]|nr:hypothetical protein [Lachnospiraceae bacterium]
MIKKSHRKAVIAGVLIAALAVGGVITARNRIAGKAVPVYPVSNVYSSIFNSSDRMEGEVTDSALQQVKKSAGMVDSIPVKVGTKIKKGDVLLKYNKDSVRLAVESDQAAIALTQAKIESAKAEIEKYQSLHPSEEMPEAVEQVIHYTADPVDTLSRVDVGTAPSEEGNIFYCTPETTVTAELLQSLEDAGSTAEFRLFEDNVEIGSWILDGASMSSGEKIITITKVITNVIDDPADPDDPELPDDPDQPDDSEDDSNVGGTEQLSENESSAEDAATEEESGDSAEKDDPGEEEENTTRTEEMAPYEDWVLGDGVEFFGDGTVSVDYSVKHYGTLMSVQPGPSEWDEPVTIEPNVDTSGENYAYSRKDLAENIKNKQQELRDLQLVLKEQELKLEEDQLVSADGSVKAAIDGTVSEVKDPAEVKEGELLVTVKGDSGFTITAYVSEYMIRDIQVGEFLQVSNYESGPFSAEVTDLSLEPVQRNMYGGGNQTYYPVTAVCHDIDTEPVKGDYYDVERTVETEQSDKVYLTEMYIRKDTQGSYCMLADENDRLKKVYVQIGGSYSDLLEIASGVTLEDRIAFPYGKNVQEGSPVVDQDMPDENS